MNRPRPNMTAIVGIRTAIAVAAVLGTAYVAVARRMVARQCFGSVALTLAALAGLSASLLTVLPSAIWIARTDLPRTPAALLLVLPTSAAIAAALFFLERPRASVWIVIGVATLAVLPGASFAVGAGAVAGAVRVEHDCEGNLRALGRAFEEYRAAKKTWPPEARWIDELLPHLPYPKAFRCPAIKVTPYQYHKPPDNAFGDAAIIVCRHPFVGHEVVLRKDLQVEVRFIKNRENPPVRGGLRY